LGFRLRRRVRGPNGASIYVRPSSNGVTKNPRDSCVIWIWCYACSVGSCSADQSASSSAETWGTVPRNLETAQAMLALSLSPVSNRANRSNAVRWLGPISTDTSTRPCRRRSLFRTLPAANAPADDKPSIARREDRAPRRTSMMDAICTRSGSRVRSVRRSLPGTARCLHLVTPVALYARLLHEFPHGSPEGKPRLHGFPIGAPV
jgi:hypothetical protein